MTEPGVWNIVSAQEKNAIHSTIICGLQVFLAAQHLFPHFLIAEPQISFEKFPSLILSSHGSGRVDPISLFHKLVCGPGLAQFRPMKIRPGLFLDLMRERYSLSI